MILKAITQDAQLLKGIQGDGEEEEEEEEDQ